MRRFLWGCMALCVAGAMTASSAQASGSLSVGDTVKLRNGPGSTGGGEFGIYETPDDADPYNFRTFCVERNQSISFSPAWYVAGINGFSTHGGGVGQTVPLSKQTAALFRQYSLGLADYISSSGVNNTYDFFGDATATFTYTGSINAKTLVNSASSDADDLQNAIWSAQGQQAAVSNKFVTAYFTALASAGGVNVGGVKILDLRSTSDHSDYKQDQLYWDGSGDNFIPVPEPASVTLFALGMVGAAVYSRRRRKSLAV